MIHSDAKFSRRFILVLLAVAPCGALADATSPAAVVGALMDAMQRNDAQRIRSAFSQEARQVYGAGAPRSGDAFRAWLESDIIAPHGRVENPEYAVEGNSVVVTGTYRNNTGYRSDANFLMRVEGGRITSWQMRY